MTKMALLMTASVFVLLSFINNAYALGSNEEKVLQTLGGIYVIEKIVDYSNQKNDRRYERPPTSDEQRAYERGVLDRERQEAAERRRRAYECGYSGDC